MFAERRVGRVGVVLVAAAVIAALGSFATWRATPARAAPLLFFDLNAGARGFNYFNASGADAGLGDPGAAVGETRASLASGPVGYGLSSVAWPGPLAANAGTLLLVMNPAAPTPVGDALNYPVRAEARTGQDPPETRYDGLPGTELTSSATVDKVTADARIAGAAGVPGTFGTTTAHSEVMSSEAGGAAESFSLVEDIDLGGGVIHIESVRSTARAVTDGTTADGAATTVVTGMTVGGQPASIDENGFRIGDASQPANAVANQLASAALSSAGFTIYVSAPQKEARGADVVVTAGSIVISHAVAGGRGFGTLVLGGAMASVAGTLGVPVPGEPALGEPNDIAGPNNVGGSDESGSDVFTDGAPVITSPASGRDEPSGGAGAAVVVADVNVLSPGRPIRPPTVMLAVLSAVMMLAGLRRLSDQVLAERSHAISCALDGPGR